MKRIWEIALRKRELPANAPHLIAALAILWFGHIALTCYSTAHWDLLQATSRIEVTVPTTLSSSLANNSTLESFDRDIIETTIKDTWTDIDKLSKARSRIMAHSASYHLAGFLAIFFWSWGFRTGPKWLALIFVPVPVFGLYMLGLIM